MSDYLKLVGTRIREVRKSKNLSQAKLAEMVGTQDTYIGSVERGERNISLNTLLKITDALEISLPSIFNFNEIEEMEHLNEKQLILQIIDQKLAKRSLTEIKMIQRIIDDVFTTIDSEYKQS